MFALHNPAPFAGISQSPNLHMRFDNGWTVSILLGTGGMLEVTRWFGNGAMDEPSHMTTDELADFITATKSL
jgi:hypothetical protein